MDEKKMAQALGWFSIGLGLMELANPGCLTRYLGLDNREELVRAYGARELAAGVGILAQDKDAPWVWSRVGGDFLDLVTLASAFNPGNRRQDRVGIALGIVAAITALDIITAQKLSTTGG